MDVQILFEKPPATRFIPFDDTAIAFQSLAVSDIVVTVIAELHTGEPMPLDAIT